MSRPVILCVDDERIILSSLKAQLQNNLSASFQIEVAESAEEALEITHELIRENIEVPIVIADQIMPGMKGDELLSQIKTLLPQTLTIMLTGQASADAVGKAVNKAGLFRYLSKPWDEDDLILTIQSALDSYSHQKNLLKQSHYQMVINKTLSLAIGTLNFKQQISKSLNYLLSVPCLCPPSQGAIYLSSKSHVFDPGSPKEESNQLVLKKVCEQPESNIHNEFNIQAEDLDKYRECLFIEKTSDTLGYFSYPILFEEEIVGLLFVYIDSCFCHTKEISSFLSSFSQTLSSIYRLSQSNYAFKQSNEKLKKHKLELENLVKQRTEALNKALCKQEKNNVMLLAANKELAYFATTDSLTGLLNRRHFFELAEQWYKKLTEQKQICSVAMIDIDYFKAINDNYGHQTGDELLKKVAKTIQDSFDQTALIGRFGGEEFALLLPEVSVLKAQKLCNTLLGNVSNTTIHIRSSQPPTTVSVTVSVGLTQINDQDKNIEQALSRADKALYGAKDNGRNTISLFNGEA
tara:strand:+ start:12679 stop:14241 length:1563 start_codon:yes stop_codon:yes gene_type:complete